MADNKKQSKVWDNIPSWAVYALEYGIEEDPLLETDEENMIIKFLEENFPEGCIMTVDWDSRREFNPFPAFGKPLPPCHHSHEPTASNPENRAKPPPCCFVLWQ